MSHKQQVFSVLPALRTAEDRERDIIRARVQKPSYQCLELRTTYAEKKINNTTYQCLKSCEGLQPYGSSAEFDDSFLTRIMQATGEDRLEFFILVAMYNEGPDELNNTLSGVCRNIKHFASEHREISHDKIACIFIVDGMEPFLKTYKQHQSTYERLVDLDKVYDYFPDIPQHVCKYGSCHNAYCGRPDTLARIQTLPNQEIAHVFCQEYYHNEDQEQPLQLIFCIKQHNKRKLNTHLWFFEGFCYMADPRCVMLLDIGTKPLGDSLWKLYESLVTNTRHAGVCGEIKPMSVSFRNPIEMAQKVEYKFAHVFDKALESSFGFITVLPGAFSAYKWEALQGDPLWRAYFKSFVAPYEMNAYNSNIYLAEDRVLSLALVSKKKNNYILHFVKDSVAETDVPDTIDKLLAQRRRWINGSWFALIDSLQKFDVVFGSRHSCCFKICMSLEMIYYVINVIFSFLMVGMFFLAFVVVLRFQAEEDIQNNDGTEDSEEDQNVNTLTYRNAFVILYMIMLLFVFIMSLGVKPVRVFHLYTIISYIFGFFMIFIMYISVRYILKEGKDNQWVFLMVSINAGCFAVGLILHRAVGSILPGLLHFIAMTPTYVNLFLIYAFCNIQDCTWGNRPDQLTDTERQKQDDFKKYRTFCVLFWVACNSVFFYFVNKLEKHSDEGFWYVASIAILGTVFMVIKLVGSVLYLLLEVFQKNYEIHKHKIRPKNREYRYHILESNGNEQPSVSQA